MNYILDIFKYQKRKNPENPKKQKFSKNEKFSKSFQRMRSSSVSRKVRAKRKKQLIAEEISFRIATNRFHIFLIFEALGVKNLKAYFLVTSLLRQ